MKHLIIGLLVLSSFSASADCGQCGKKVMTEAKKTAIKLLKTKDVIVTYADGMGSVSPSCQAEITFSRKSSLNEYVVVGVDYNGETCKLTKVEDVTP